MLYTIEIKDIGGDLHIAHFSDWNSLMFFICGVLCRDDKVGQYRVTNHNGVVSAKQMGVGGVNKLVTEFTW